MKDLSSWAFANKRLVQFFIFVAVVGGLFSAWQMSKLEDPEVKVKMAVVATVYPGASAHQVELEVTDPLEKAIRSVTNVHAIESYSYADLSIITVELESTVKTAEVEQLWDILRRKVSDAASLLPPGCRQPQVQEDFSNVYGLFYAMTADGFTPSEINDYAEMVRATLLDLDGVDRVQLYGVPSEAVYISLNTDRMATLGVKPVEVLATLNGRNDVTYAGYFDNGPGQRVKVNVTSRFDSIDDIAEMIIAGHENDRLRLSDIATVERRIESPRRTELLRDGEEAVGILVSGRSGSDIVKVGHEVDEAIAQLEATRLPAGVTLHRVFNQPERVTSALSTFFINLIESVLIVVLILMLTMGWRSGWMIGISLVTIVTGSFLFLYAFNGTMQRVSLGAFILAMGMLVDNAIVIIDGILVGLRQGMPRREALTQIGRRTAMPLLGATLIAILAFLPIFLSPDTTGVYVRDLFIVLSVSLLLSWVMALVHVPLMADRRLRHIKPLSVNYDNSIDAENSLYKGRAYKILQKTVGAALRHRVATICIMVGLLALSLWGFRFVKQGFFPDMDYDQLYLEYRLPEGTNSTQVKADLAEIEAYLKSQPYIKNVTTSVGASPGRYNLVRSVQLPTLAYGELIVDFTSSKELKEHIGELQEWIDEHYPQAYAKLKRYNLMFKKYPIEAQFTGPDPAVLTALADSAEAVMRRSGVVHLITRDLEAPTPTLNVVYNPSAASAVGLSRKDVSMSLLSAAGGVPFARFYDGIHAKNIYLTQVNADGSQVADLSNIPVFSTLPDLSALLDPSLLSSLTTSLATGTMPDRNEIINRLMSTTPLRQVIDSISVTMERPVIPRYNGRRMVRVQASPVDGVETERARKAIAEEIEKIQLPEGYSLTWQGEKAASTQSMRYLFLNFPLAIILIIAILIMLFKDYRKPIIILLTIPMVFVGVVATMIICRKPFDFVAIVGTLGLIGMVIKNGIVLMDEINRRFAMGIERRKALIGSAVSRLRPVSMAALTTILGMLPLLGDSMFGSLAASIMGGLLFGTVITLIFIPVLYSLFFPNDNKK